MNVRETDLIGIGKKFQMKASSGEELIIVIHDDGRREIYRPDPETGDVNLVMTLTDEESRQVGGIIGGMAYKPKALENVEVAINDLAIEWYKVTAECPSLSKSIGELEVRKQTGTSIIAAITDAGTEINPGPDYVIRPGVTLVVAGKRGNIGKLKEMLVGR